MREFLNNLYDHHQSLKVVRLPIFSMDLLPHLNSLSMIPVIGKIVTPIAESVDSLIPGKKYDTIQDILNNKPSSGSGMKRPRGRPRKIKDVQIEVINIDPTKTLSLEKGRRGRGRPRKIF